MTISFSPWPSFTQEEADAVSRVLLSNKVNYWTGQKCREFEKEFAAWTGSQYAIALANGTVALDLALIGLGIGKGDEVIVTPRTFMASASTIISVGAIPIFADVDRDSQNITAETVSKVLSSRTKAIICVHLNGWPCDMDPIMELAERHNLKVIEDCAQAHGAKYKGKSVGSIGHVGAWSFCQDKIMTLGGEGGMVTTNDKALWQRMWEYKDHGKSYDAVYHKEHAAGFRWVIESFGTNWRMMEMQAAIGRIQLKQMPEWTAKRQANGRCLQEVFDTCSLIRHIAFPEYIEHACYKYYAFIQPELLAEDWTRDRIIAEINAAGVPCFHGSCSEVYLEKAFEGSISRPTERLPVAKELGETSLMFLVHPTLTTENIDKMCLTINSVFKKATC